jgi:hypothetical protein
MSDRDEQGRWQPGESASPATQWGPENPPPKSPGRPRKDAWLGALEAMLAKDERVPEALAARLMKIALKGRDADALKALELMQNRIAGPPKQQIEAEVHSHVRKIIVVGTNPTPPSLPAEVLEIERRREQAENRS